METNIGALREIVEGVLSIASDQGEEYEKAIVRRYADERDVGVQTALKEYIKVIQPHITEHIKNSISEMKLTRQERLTRFRQSFGEDASAFVALAAAGNSALDREMEIHSQKVLIDNQTANAERLSKALSKWLDNDELEDIDQAAMNILVHYSVHYVGKRRSLRAGTLSPEGTKKISEILGEEFPCPACVAMVEIEPELLEDDRPAKTKKAPKPEVRSDDEYKEG